MVSASKPAPRSTIEPVNRHHRQIILPQIGETGQERLRASHALVVGVGALGTVIAEALCRAGVGTLTLVDRDVVELTNLQRQTLYTEQDARDAKPKAIAAKDRLSHIDAAVRVRALADDFSPATAPAIVGFDWDEHEHPPASPPVTLLLDGTDNFETRYLLNDVAVSQRLPFVCAGAVGAEGTLFTVRPGVGPCVRCLFPDLPPPGSEPTCDTAGVLGPTAGAIASLAAAEAIKLLAGRADAANRRLIHLDAWTPAMRAVDIADAKRDACPCCARRRFDFLDAAAGEVISLCGRRSVQIAPASRAALDLPALAARLAPFGDFTVSDDTLRGTLTTDIGEFGPITLHLFRTGRAIIGGTTNQAKAKSLYSKLVGS